MNKPLNVGYEPQFVDQILEKTRIENPPRASTQDVGLQNQPEEDMEAIAVQLRTHECVSGAEVVLIPGDNAQETFVGIVTLSSPLEAASRTPSCELHCFVYDLVPGQWRFRVMIVDSIPTAADGRVDIEAVARLCDSEIVDQSSPLSSTEASVFEIWVKVLGIKNFCRDQDFFELGADSLLATRALSGIHEKFGVEVPLTFLFESFTVAGLANVIGRLTSHDTAA